MTFRKILILLLLAFFISGCETGLDRSTNREASEGAGGEEETGDEAASLTIRGTVAPPSAE